MIILFSSLLLIASAPAPKAPAQHWGAAETLAVAPTPLAKTIGETKSGSTVLVTAKAESVCVKKGCWVMLRDGDVSVRVTMKDYGFFLPEDIAGKSLVVEGVLAETVVKEKDARHFAKDEGKSKDEIAAIKGDSRSWSLVASSIRLAE